MLNRYNQLFLWLVPPKVKLAKTRNGVDFVLVLCIPAVEKNALQKIAAAGVVERKNIFMKHANRHQNL